MKNKLARLVLAGTLPFASLALASSTFAADVGNSDTGASSENNTSVTIENNTTVSQSNDLTVTNDIFPTANTGDNSASKNTGDGSVSSGDISGSVTLENTGNQNLLDPAAPANGEGIDFTVTNSQTGADSENSAKVHFKNDLDLVFSNKASVKNDIGALLNTGGNSSDKNTGDGSVSSGDINFMIGVENLLNINSLGGIGGEIPTPPDGTNGPSGVLPKVGAVLAAALGTLPITGSGGFFLLPFVFLATGALLKVSEKWASIRFSKN